MTSTPAGGSRLYEYDHVVVGAGSAGCVLASRLSEDPSRSVLLVEAGGPDDSPLIRDPAAWPMNLGGSTDWGFQTVPQAATDFVGHAWPRGRVLGGSSSLDASIWLRGQPEDYDRWASAGAEGWAWDDVLPAFIRSETTRGGDPGLRGRSGPVRVRQAETFHPLTSMGMEAAGEVGHPFSADLNGAEHRGAGLLDLAIDDGGSRQSAAVAYLTPEVLARPNLRLRLRATVARVQIERGRAVGVVVLEDGDETLIRSASDVLLTAGVIGSPQLLLRSGIGPAADLRTIGVPVQVDLDGVGGGLQDHVLTGVTYTAREPVPPTPTQWGDAAVILSSGVNGTEADLQLLLMHMPYPFPQLEPVSPGYTIGVALTRPRSRGRLRLTSTDPAAPPLIDPAYLADSRDREALTVGVEFARELGAASAYGPVRAAEALPAGRGPGAVQARVARTSTTYFHPVGTCAMGRGPDCVVDCRLRVRGVENLRVVDASIMPSIPAANTRATVVMIAERAASMLRNR